MKEIAEQGNKRIPRITLSKCHMWHDDVAWEDGLKCEMAAGLGIPYGCQMWERDKNASVLPRSTPNVVTVKSMEGSRFSLNKEIGMA